MSRKLQAVHETFDRIEEVSSGSDRSFGDGLLTLERRGVDGAA